MEIRGILEGTDFENIIKDTSSFIEKNVLRIVCNSIGHDYSELESSIKPGIMKDHLIIFKTCSRCKIIYIEESRSIPRIKNPGMFNLL